MVPSVASDKVGFSAGARHSAQPARKGAEDTLGSILVTLFPQRIVDALYVGSANSDKLNVLSVLHGAFDSTIGIVSFQAGNPSAAMETRPEKIAHLESFDDVAQASLDLIVCCPTLGQIVSTIEDRGTNEFFDALKPGGVLITFGVHSGSVSAPADPETAGYFERHFASDKAELPPSLAAKYEFVQSVPRTPGGKSYLAWLVLRKRADAPAEEAEPVRGDLPASPEIPAPDPDPSAIARIDFTALRVAALDAGAVLRNGIAFRPAPRGRQPVVFSIVPNSCVFDARVLKQARALTHGGYKVRIYARAEAGCANEEEVDGIEFRRIPGFDSDTNVPAEIREMVLDLFGPYRENMADKLRQVEEASQLGVLLRNESDALRAKILSARNVQQKAMYVEHRSAFSRIYQRAIVHFRDVKRSVLPELRYYYFTANLLSQIFDLTPDIIHAHDLLSLPAAIAVGKAAGAKIVFDAHEVEVERVPPLPIYQKTFVDVLERHWLKGADRMVTVCESAAEFYAARFAGTRATVVMNVPEIARGDGFRFDLREAAGLRLDAQVAVYIGSVGREPRGLDKVVEALRLLPDLHLVVIGPRHAGNDVWLMAAAKAQGVEDRVHLVPPVEPDRVVEAVQTADVAVCPIQDASFSYRVSMPNKLFEAAFAGVPICVSDLPEMGRFVESFGIGRIMDQTDPASIASVITEVLANREKYVPSRTVLERLEREFSWTAQSSRLTDLYRQLLAAQ
jgi:glycosyltransferase involved in cell wall biosynthesis